VVLKNSRWQEDADPFECLNDVLHRAKSGDASALPILRDLVTSAQVRDETAELIEKYRTAVVHLVAGDDLVYREIALRDMEQTRNDLSTAASTPLELLLIERIAICKLALYDAEFRAIDARQDGVEREFFWQAHINRAQRRYLSALKSLALVSRLKRT
jgi:hypothetical protein